MQKNLIKFIVYLTPLFFYGAAMGYEEPIYKVVKKTDIYEIRHYSERIVAQVTFGYEDSGFQKLFRYISGSNNENQEIQMTTPVNQERTEEKMIMQFFLPAKYTLENAPQPKDPNVTITSIKEGYYAVIQYSGRASESNFIKHYEILREALVKDTISMNEPPIKATYDGPYTLPVLRRNEAMFNVKFTE